MRHATGAMLRMLAACRTARQPAAQVAAASSSAPCFRRRSWPDQGPQSASTSATATAQFTTIPEPQDAYLYDAQLQRPNYVQPISIQQLDSLCRNPTVERLVNSSSFMKQQVPARLENHIYRLKKLQPESEPLRAILEESGSIKSDLLEVVRDWRLVDTSTAAGLAHFESHLRMFKEGLDSETERLSASARSLTEQIPHWWDDAQQVQDLNRALDLCHWFVLSARVMVTQHLAALHALQRRPAPQLQGPPGLEQRFDNLIARHASVRQVLEFAAEDCRALCIEKNSAAPDVEFVGGEDLRAAILEPYVGYVFSEVLKNAMQAVIQRYGAWDVDEAEPVQVQIREPEAGSTHFSVTVVDHANGIPEGYGNHMYDYFQSTARRASLAGWRDSRTHGTTEKGQGVGVPMARVYAHFMGGSAEWQTTVWPHRGCTVVLRLPRLGFTF